MWQQHVMFAEKTHTVVELFEFERTYFPGDFVLDWPD